MDLISAYALDNSFSWTMNPMIPVVLLAVFSVLTIARRLRAMRAV